MVSGLPYSTLLVEKSVLGVLSDFLHRLSGTRCHHEQF